MNFLLYAAMAMLAGTLCACAKAESSWYRELREEVEVGGVGQYVLYIKNDRWTPKLEESISDLLDDRFFLDVGRLPELDYILCGSYRLPLGENKVRLVRRGSVLDPGDYNIWFTIDRDCAVQRVIGVKFEPVRL
ncbi:MAG TPA: hypothetical protein VGN80_01920 [Devosiaceae bacterium]|nr:hypothetical protein [Devosiaceae bacterium]